MSSIGTVRESVATALSGVDGYSISPRPGKVTPKGGDGWIVLGTMTPTTAYSTRVEFIVLVVLGPDIGVAEGRLESDGTALLATVAETVNAEDITLEPTQILVGTSSVPVYAATITFTTDVD